MLLHCLGHSIGCCVGGEGEAMCTTIEGKHRFEVDCSAASTSMWRQHLAIGHVAYLQSAPALLTT